MVDRETRRSDGTADGAPPPPADPSSPRRLARGLARRLRGLSPEEFWDEYDRSCEVIHRYVAGHVRAQDAVDVTMVAVITAYERRRLYAAARGSFVNWVIGFAWRTIMNLRDDPRQRRHVSLDLTSQDHADPGLGPDEILVAREDARTVVDCLERLKPRYREVIQFRYVLGLSIEEIATHQGASCGTVRQWLKRGRDQLAAMLLDQGRDGRLSPQASAAVAEFYAERGGLRVIDGKDGQD